jgi:small subunit ribosomal protein S16
VEIVGHYNPRTKPAKVEIDRERINHWIEKGAQLSDTVRTLLKRHASAPAPAASASAQSATPDKDKTAGKAAGVSA